MATKIKKNRRINSFSLGERVAYLRKRRKLTQAELAKASGISQSTIAQIESGRKDPSIKTLEKIAMALDFHIAVLFAGDNIHVFDMDRLNKKYDKVDKLNETLYFALGKVVRYAKDIGFIK